MEDSTLEFFKRLEDSNSNIFDLIKNNTATKVEKGKDGKIKIEEFELDDDYYNIDKDFKDIIAELKQLHINVDNLVQFYNPPQNPTPLWCGDQGNKKNKKCLTYKYI